MESIFAKLKNLRVAPKKVRQVTRLLKGMNFDQAEAHLRYMPQKSVPNLRKLLLSAAANAENNFNLSRQDLFVLKILVDPGPTLKRMMPRARGRGEPINKRTSHITIFLASRTGQRSAKLGLRSHSGEGGGSGPASKKSEQKKTLKASGPASKSKKAHVQDKSTIKGKSLKSSGVKQKIFSRKAI